MERLKYIHIFVYEIAWELFFSSLKLKIIQMSTNSRMNKLGLHTQPNTNTWVERNKLQVSKKIS